MGRSGGEWRALLTSAGSEESCSVTVGGAAEGLARAGGAAEGQHIAGAAGTRD